MLLKRVFYASASVMMLALAFHFGAVSATAQAGSSVTGISWSDTYNGMFVMTNNGDCFFRSTGGPPNTTFIAAVFALGNFWGGATPVQPSTFGSLKARYRGERGAAQPAPVGR